SDSGTDPAAVVPTTSVGPHADAPPPSPHWAVGDVILDHFVIEGELGRGGMGAVHLARSRATGERFAVKRALCDGPGTQRAFLTEVQTWLDLPAHPHLVACRFVRTI